MHSSKEINAFQFSLFGFCYEVYLHFLPLPAKHFQQEHSLCHDSNICETAYPVSSHQKLPLPGCFCWFWEDFVSFFYWYFTVVPFDTFFLVRAIFTFLTLINIFFTDISGFRFRMNWKNLNKTLKYCLIYIKYLFLCERNIVILQKTLLGFDYAAGESRKVTFFDTEVFKGFPL